VESRDVMRRDATMRETMRLTPAPLSQTDSHWL
jgi:hypothetical protein